MALKQVVIFGGHGKIALLLARKLSATKQFHVRSIFRKPEQKDDVAATGAEPVVFDLENASEQQIASVLRGTDVVVWSAGAGGGDEARTYAVDRDAAIRSMKAAKHAGVGRYIMVSYLGARKNHGVSRGNSFFAYAEAKAAADDFLRTQSGLDWTILMPGSLSLDPASDKIELNPPEDLSKKVSRENVALVIESVLSSPGTSKKDIPFLDGDTPISEAIASYK